MSDDLPFPWSLIRRLVGSDRALRRFRIATLVLGLLFLGAGILVGVSELQAVTVYGGGLAVGLALAGSFLIMAALRG